MMRYMVFIVVMLNLIMINYPSVVEAADVVRILGQQSSLDERHMYHNAILITALEKTRDAYGDFIIEKNLSNIQRERILRELIAGNRINVSIAVTQKKWESSVLPIRIPILKGLLGYRLLLIKKQNEKKFLGIKSAEELMKLKAGLSRQWSTALAMDELGFTIVGGGGYEGLFKMLMWERFDYFPRGVNEVFSELDSRHELMPDMVIESELALYLPSPSYFFVSPKYPRLAKRIESGLMLMIKDGSFDKLFWKYHGENIEKANLKNRTIIKVKNPLLPPETPFDKEELWFDPIWEK